MNNTKFFADVYYLKRAQLLSEYLTGNLEKIDELYNNEFKNKVKDADTVDSLLEVVNSFTQKIKDSIANDDIYEEMMFYSDYDKFTDEHHHRKYWNEIENHESIDDILHQFLSIFDCDDIEENETEYIISLYDFNNFEINCRSYDECSSLECNYDIEPYTVFERSEDGSFVESYSA